MAEVPPPPPPPPQQQTEPTMLELWCLSMASNDGTFFSLKIDSTKKGADLVTALKKLKPSDFGPIDSDNIRVCTAKKADKSWIALATPLAKQLKNAKVPHVQDLFKIPGLVTEEVERWEALKDVFSQTNDQQLHVLVVTPLRYGTSHPGEEAIPEVGAEIQWEKADALFPALEIAAGPIVRIPAAYAINSGLVVRDEYLLLYRRPQLVAEWQTLRALVCDTYAELWIMGPPGTGKSCGAFAFACSLDRSDWDVVWIHFPKRGAGLLQCILFRGENEKQTCSIKREDLDALLESLHDKTIVFLDGFTTEKYSKEVVDSCLYWRGKNKLYRRLVWVSSMLQRGRDYHPITGDTVPVTAEATLKSKAVFDTAIPKAEVKDEEIFKLESWTMEEYKEAVADDDFYDHVKAKLSCDPARWADKDQLLENKFFVAGGSARYMFDCSIEEAEDDLKNAINATPDIELHIRRKIGITSAGAVTQLFSWSRDKDSNEAKANLLSCFVAGRLAQQLGPDFVQDISILFPINPSMDGYLFELWFFAKLVHGGIRCYTNTKDTTSTDCEIWSAREVPYFDPLGTTVLNGGPQWLAPREWNQGGYDAVFVGFRGANPQVDTRAVEANCTTVIKVRFVQVTRAKKHSFKESFFKTLLTRLTSALTDYWFEEVEVCFVVPHERLVKEGFKPAVDGLQMDKDVLQPANLSKNTTRISIRTFGVDYSIFKENRAKRLKTG